MAKSIVWNKRARTRFDQIISYLKSDWNENVTRNFVVRTYQLVELLADYPDLGTLEDESRNIRGIILTKHNILFYRYTEDEITILNIFDTRRSPSKKKY